MPTIVVAYTPNEQGEAALERGIEEAGLRSARLVVVNATKGEALVDPRAAGRPQWPPTRR